jgi:hypothetical protein
MSETSLFESAQALFCSIADSLGVNQSKKVLDLKTYPTFSDFQEDNKKLIDTALKQANITETPQAVYNFLLKSDSWYKSSVAIANKIVKDLTDIDSSFNIKKKGYEGTGFHWFRGDKEVMGGIEALYKIANKGTSTTTALWGKGNTSSTFFGYGNVNKWNPADIYYANKTAKNAIKKELTRAAGLKQSYGFSGGNIKKGSVNSPIEGDGLNLFIERLIEGGDLLPLSLKKATGSVTLRPVNFVKDIKNELLDSITYTGKSEWKVYKRLDKDKRISWSLYSTKKGTTETRDIKLYFDSDVGKGEIKIRHDPSDSGRFVAEILYGGAKAKAGSIASWKQFALIWGSVDPTAASTFKREYVAGDTAFKKEKSAITSKLKVALRQNKMPSNKKITEYDHYMAIASAENITNKIIPVIVNWFTKSNKAKKTLFIRLMFQVVTSRSPMSSRFVIAK